MTKSKIKKVEGWETRNEDPFRTYQNILAKYAKKKAVDEEEKAFFSEVEKMLKSGELKVLTPNEEGYNELMLERIQKKFPNNSVEWYKDRKEPEWFKNYISETSAWISQNPGKSEEDYRVANKVSFNWFSDDIKSGIFIVWDSEKSKTFTYLKYS